MSVTKLRPEFGIAVPFTPYSKHIMFYGFGMCDSNPENDRIYGTFIISGAGWDAVPLLE